MTAPATPLTTPGELHAFGGQSPAPLLVDVAGLPLREGRRRLPVDRQVQLIAGLMVLAGVGLGTLVNPWFLVLAAFFGAGLTFAGATGTCGLAVVLMRMPWNRLPAGLPPAAGATCAARDAAPGAAPTNRDR